MIKLEQVKVKHLRQNKEIFQQLMSVDDISELDVFGLLDFAASLVLEWDFVDSGQPIPVGETDNLSIEQLTELFAEFSKLKFDEIPVPKLRA